MSIYRISYPKVSDTEFHELLYKLIDFYAKARIDIQKKKLDYLVFFLVWVFISLLLIIALIVNLYYGRNMRPFLGACALYVFLCASGGKRILGYHDFIKYCNKIMERAGYYNSFVSEFVECDETLNNLSKMKLRAIGFLNIQPLSGQRFQAEGVKKDGTVIKPMSIFIYIPPQTDHQLGDFTYIDDVYTQMQDDMKIIEKGKPEYGDYSR